VRFLSSKFDNNRVVDLLQYDGSLERLHRESVVLQEMYGHMFDITIVNNDIEETVLELERAIQRLYSGPQWVPVAWVY